MQCDAVENKECCGVCDLPPPNPSITVGTQVRLTGVVHAVSPQEKSDGKLGVWVEVGNEGNHRVWLEFEEAEVIRQPFKRGEVVWFTGPLVGGDQGKRVVVDDEADDRVLVASPTSDATVCLNPASYYERRP